MALYLTSTNHKTEEKKMLRGNPETIASVRVRSRNSIEALNCLLKTIQGLEVSPWAREVLAGAKRKVAVHDLEIVRIVSEIDLSTSKTSPTDKNTKRTLRIFYQNILSEGYILLIPEIIPDIILQVGRGVLKESVFAMKPVDCVCPQAKSGVQPVCLNINDWATPESPHIGFGTFPVTLDGFVDGGLHFLAARPTQELIRQGCHIL